MASSSDEVRDALLRHLYDVHQRARSVKATSIGIRDLQSSIKSGFGFRQQEVASNLDYLLQKGWVSEVVEERTFTTPRGTTQSASRVTYKISDVGIDHLEGASMYKRPGVSQVNITNVQGVTVVGDGNVVNAKFTELSEVLAELRETILTSDLKDQTKLEAAADIDALQSQLQKPHPDPSVVGQLWSGVEKVVTAGGLIELAAKATELLAPLLS